MGYGLERRDNTAAVLLEVLPGFFFQIFGIGHIAQGRVGMGLFIMLSYWGLQSINLFLCMFLIGFVTAPLTFVFYLVASAMNAADYGKSRY